MAGRPFWSGQLRISLVSFGIGGAGLRAIHVDNPPANLLTLQPQGC